MDYEEDDEVVMQVWDTSNLLPRPLESAMEARKGSKKRKAPSDEEHEYKIKHLCKELKSYYALCKKGGDIERMLPEANRLVAAVQEKCKNLKLEPEAPKKEAAKKPRRGPGRPKKEAAVASTAAAAKAAKKPRGPGRPRKETTAPEPASRLSPPPTSGSDCSEPSEQTVASAADSGEPTPTAAAATTTTTTTTKPPTPNSETNKGPSKSPRAIKAATGARKPPGRRLTLRHTRTHDELD
ncbi:hypothetical protein QBC32DRAFT_319020 [Pseudoneurospora amorphoporcata]|uniref:Uncharacterized protein n=1 Tax=Pseudoneurospora amorphoporcata TaxID=241081 RepID=A0AAN6NK22_9PEZI|nr:hypothetical protein QBC32DRAFT_319020 [Pseudoneurospora amorphoporcata]